jgi:HlyD family secretion protein
MHNAIGNTRYAVRVLLALVVILVSGCQANSGSNSLVLNGVMEATQAMVVAEVGGRLVEIAADEGDAVEMGQALVKLDDATFQVQVKQAQAGVSAAEANLARVKAGARSEEIAAAKAALAQAQAERDGAALAFQDAVVIRNNPQQLLAQIDAARTGVRLAEQNVAVAESKLGEARWWREFHDDTKGLKYSLNKQVAIAQREQEAAQAQLDGAKAQLAALEAMRRESVTLNAQVNAALCGYSMTLASVPVVQAALAELQAGPTPEEVALAEAQLHQARAQLKLAQAYLDRATVRAPMTGIVASRSAHVGETIQPGAALMMVMNLDEVSVVIYVPQVQLPRVRVDMPVQVKVDAYPGQVFTGQVASIARHAQFSSRDTQAREDRANMVFAVKVRLPNADHRLKAGMTADATIQW